MLFRVEACTDHLASTSLRMAEIWEEATTFPPMHAWIGTCFIRKKRGEGGILCQCARSLVHFVDGRTPSDVFFPPSIHPPIHPFTHPPLLLPPPTPPYFEQLPRDQLLEFLRQRLAHVIGLVPMNNAGQGGGLLVVDLDVEPHQVVLAVAVWLHRVVCGGLCEKRESEGGSVCALHKWTQQTPPVRPSTHKSTHVLY